LVQGSLEELSFEIYAVNYEIPVPKMREGSNPSPCYSLFLNILVSTFIQNGNSLLPPDMSLHLVISKASKTYASGFRGSRKGRRGGWGQEMRMGINRIKAGRLFSTKILPGMEADP
jgi:hypothetical protein